jgi:hypothetical protein
MAKPPDQLLSFEQYGQAAEALHVLSGVLLFEFVRRDTATAARDQIARNFIARADNLECLSQTEQGFQPCTSAAMNSIPLALATERCAVVNTAEYLK